MNQKILVPEYYSKFQCIGDRCEDNCCHEGWFITVEKSMYKKYRKIKDENWREKLNSNVKRNKNGKDDASYAYLALNEKRSCSFLSQEGLCNIHKELGTAYLCETCKTYPRIRNKYNGNAEMSLSTSCPEAARLVLFEKNGLNFTYSSEISSRYLTEEIIISETSPNYLSDFWVIRSFMIEILQNRTERLEDRLKILGYFLDTVNNNSVNSNEIINHINNFRYLISSGEIQKYFMGTFENKEKLYRFLKIIKTRLHNPFLNKTFKKIIDETFVGLKLNKEDGLSEANLIYEEASTKYYDYLEDNGYKLENYLVNVIFNSLMPNKDNPLKDYAILVNYYVLLRTMIIGRLAIKNEINDEFLVNLVYSFGRNIENYNAFSAKIIEAHTNKNTLSLVDIVKLV